MTAVSYWSITETRKHEDAQNLGSIRLRRFFVRLRDFVAL
jgi:hypothetical protein